MVDHRVETTDDLRECTGVHRIRPTQHTNRPPTSAHPRRTCCRWTKALAEHRTSASIQRSETRQGSGSAAYNHFESKDELFDEAVANALDAWGALRDVVVAGIDSPAEVFCHQLPA